MAYLFTILMVFSLISAIVFVIKSLPTSSKKKGAKKNLKFAGISLFVTLFALAGVGVTAPEVNTSEKMAVNKVGEPEKVVSDNSEINAELTIDIYAERVSQALKEMGPKTSLNLLPLSEQLNGPTLMSLSNDTSISIFTDKKIVNQLSLRMSPGAHKENNEDFKFAYILLVGTTDTSLGFGDRNLILRELGLDDKEVFNKKFESSTTVGSITYSYEGSPDMGYTLVSKW